MVHVRGHTLTLPEPNPRWLVLLGPRSMDQRRGLLCPITTVEPQYAGPPRPYPRAPRLGPRAFSIDGVDSFDGGFVCQHQLRKQTLLRLSANDCYAGQSVNSLQLRQWPLLWIPHLAPTFPRPTISPHNISVGASEITWCLGCAFFSMILDVLAETTLRRPEVTG